MKKKLKTKEDKYKKMRMEKRTKEDKYKTKM